MAKRSVVRTGLFLGLALAAFVASADAQRTIFPASEFAARRQALMSQVSEGVIVLFGEVSRPPAMRFLQDNDFYYFTGSDDLGAVLVLVPRTKASYLFLPQQAPREEVMEGANLLKDPNGAAKAGVTALHPVTYLDEFLARMVQPAGTVFQLRLSPRDTVDGARGEAGIFYGRRARLHYNDQVPLDQYRVMKLRERYPQVTFADITPVIDRMRVIKSPAEIEVVRRNGRVSAEAVRQAMLATPPGAYEYAAEAAAMHVVLAHGGLGAAYAPIVGSGPNTIVQHYSDNGRQIQAGDLVLMDFGGNLDHLMMDITRTWPASGTFTPEQRAVYERVLAAEKACIEAYRPGATAEDVRKHVAEVLKQKGLEQGPDLRGGFGHGVGLATHDVPLGTVLQEAMVFAIEPALYFPETNIGIRIEDTVLITKDGCEVLTRDVPKEIAEIEALLATRRK